jgi:hypothetical protein
MSSCYVLKEGNSVKNDNATAAAEDKTYFEKHLPQEFNTPANVQRCICARCDHFDGHRYADRRCPFRDECERLRQEGQPGLFSKRRGGHTLVVRQDAMKYVMDGLVI